MADESRKTFTPDAVQPPLPLDRLNQPSPSLAGASRESVSSIADAILRELNDRVSSGRLRESR